MFDRLSIMEKQYQEMQDKLASGTLDVKEMTKLMKESSGMSDAVELFRFYKEKDSELKDLELMMEDESDQELIEMSQIEIERLKTILEETEEKLTILLLPKDPNDNKNVIMEIKGAAGGDEGNIFAGDLFRMYSKYAESKNWKIEVLNAMEGNMGGYTSIEFMVSGKLVYSLLKHESGTHRVQRVPETESMGRVHTSTATVLVMPEAEEIDIEVKWDDIRVDTYCSQGPGGQSVNTTKSAVRLTHEPTGIAVACQVGKSQHENKASAFTLLKTRIYDKFLEEQLEKEGSERKLLVGRGDRSDKIRTYNYPQNRVSDHRIGLTLQRLDVIMEGRLDLVIEPLINEFQKDNLLVTKVTYEALLKLAYQKVRSYKHKEEEAARLLLMETSNLDPHQFYINIKNEVDKGFEIKYLEMLDFYLNKDIPVQHLIGHAYFFGYPFKVNEHVLIPRSETEQLVEHILYYYDQYFNQEKLEVLDLGTGSGCIGLTLALEEKNLNVTISDISEDALKVANFNQEKLKANAKLVLSDLFENIPNSFDMIISNPPYIPDTEVVDEIVTKEPSVALYGGSLGVDFYEKILNQAKVHLKDKALIGFEHGYQQKEQILKFAKAAFPDATIIQLKDLQGKDRFTFIGLGGVLA